MPSPSRTTVLRPDLAQVTRARMDSDLRTAPYARRFAADPRLVDPTLEAAFAATAELVREEARQQGYAEGYLAGQQAAAVEARSAAEAARQTAEAAQRLRDEEVARGLQAVHDGLLRLERAGAPSVATVEDTVVAIAVRLAEALVGHELAISTTPGADAIARALVLAPEGEAVTVRLNPADATELPTSSVVGGRVVTVVADPAVEPHGCVLDCGFSRIDAQVAPALQRVRDALGLAANGSPV